MMREGHVPEVADLGIKKHVFPTSLSSAFVPLVSALDCPPCIRSEEDDALGIVTRKARVKRDKSKGFGNPFE